MDRIPLQRMWWCFFGGGCGGLCRRKGLCCCWLLLRVWGVCWSPTPATHPEHVVSYTLTVLAWPSDNFPMPPPQGNQYSEDHLPTLSFCSHYIATPLAADWLCPPALQRAASCLPSNCRPVWPGEVARFSAVLWAEPQPWGEDLLPSLSCLGYSPKALGDCIEFP